MARNCYKQRVWVDVKKIKSIAENKGGMKKCVENHPGYAYHSVNDVLRRTNHITIDMAIYLENALDCTLSDIIALQ